MEVWGLDVRTGMVLVEDRRVHWVCNSGWVMVAEDEERMEE